jgi:hypothetical protein
MSGNLKPCSPYLERPLRSLHQVCAADVIRYGIVPFCHACTSKQLCEMSLCESVTQHMHRLRKKRNLDAASRGEIQ